MSAVLNFKTSGGCDNTIEFTFDNRRSAVLVEVEHPWHGDSESGFGVSLIDELTKEQAEQLYWWLKGHLGK